MDSELLNIKKENPTVQGGLPNTYSHIINTNTLEGQEESELGKQFQTLVTYIIRRVRTDISAVKKDGKSLWRRNQALTKKRLLQHLNGGLPRGVCPIKEGESTIRLALFDLDSHKGETTWEEMGEVVLVLMNKLKTHGMNGIPFRSSGGKGIHLFLIWKNPQDAYSVREFLMSVLSELGYKNGTGGVVKKEIEIFPKQNSVPIGGCGNQFILPLAGLSAPLIELDGFQVMEKNYIARMDWSVSVDIPFQGKPIKTKYQRPSKCSNIISILRELLLRIEPGADNYDVWFKIGAVIHYETKGSADGLELWREYSKRGIKYKADEAFEKIWNSLDHSKESVVKIGTLKKLARDGSVGENFIVKPERVEANESRIPDSQHLTTHQSNVDRLMKHFGGRLMVFAGQWYFYCGTHWARDESMVYSCAMALSKVIHQEADEWDSKPSKDTQEVDTNKEIAKSLKKWAKQSEMRNNIDAVIALARKVLTICGDKLDANPMFLNCLNGTVNLRTGELSKHNPADYITQITPVAYHPDVKANLFEHALSQITLEEGKESQPLAKFLQIWYGYCATGLVTEQKFMVHYGGGSNGKSTIIGIIETVLGDYASTAAPDLLMVSGNDRHPTEIAALHQCRMVTASESGSGKALREDFIKQMTGGDTLKARRMRQDFFEFKPSHKLQLVTNHKPTIKGSDHGIWRRVLLMPYHAKFGTEDKVLRGEAMFVGKPTLKEDLLLEKEGILNWIVQGAIMWSRDGLNPPDAVMAASADYQSQQDRVAQFVEEVCELGQAFETPLNGTYDIYGGIFPAYILWCKDSGFHSLGKTNFLEELQRIVPAFSKKESKTSAASGAKRKSITKIIGIRLCV